MTKIQVKVLSSAAPNALSTVSIALEPHTPMYEVKLQLQQATGIPVKEQKVMLAGIGEMCLLDKRSNIGQTFCGKTYGWGLATMGTAETA